MFTTKGRTNPRRLYAAVTVEDQSLRCILAEDFGEEMVVVADEATDLAFRDADADAGLNTIANQVMGKLKIVMPRRAKLAGIGVSTPGTIDTKTKTLLDVPRRGWKAVHNAIAVLNFKDLFKDWVENADHDIVVDNDATMSALGERWARLGKRPITAADDFAYIRAGIGINGAAFIGGRPWHGALHPEMGHIMIRPHESDPGGRVLYLCTIHKGCLEGSVGYARLRLLAKHYHGDWSLVDEIAGYYIGQLCQALALFLACPRIIIAGTTIEGAEKPERLLKCIRTSFAKLLDGYPRNTVFSKPDYITRATLPVTEASWRGALCAAIDPGHPQRGS